MLLRVPCYIASGYQGPKRAGDRTREADRSGAPSLVHRTESIHHLLADVTLLSIPGDAEFLFTALLCENFEG